MTNKSDAQPSIAVQPTLMDLLIVFVFDGTILIFFLWLIFRITGSHIFDDLPPFIVGSYGFFTSLTTGAVGLGAVVIDNLTRTTPRPNYNRLFAGSLLAALLLMTVIALTVTFVNELGTRWLVNKQSNNSPQSQQSAETQTRPAKPQQPAPPFVKAFKVADVSRLGTMRSIQVTVTEVSPPPPRASFNLEYKWTGSGGTQNGSQDFVLAFKGKEGATLASFTFSIDRSHCFYGGGNDQQRSGTLAFDPNLIEGVEIRLNEVVGRMGVC